MKPGRCLLFLLLPALLLATAGCSQPAAPITPNPTVYIVYGSEKGDLSYTDSAYLGLAAAQQNLPITTREFVPRDYTTLPDILNSTTAVSEQPRLVITVGFQYANFTRELARAHPDIRFLAIDQTGAGPENLRTYEISSYGDSYLAGVLAASATKTGHIGIILGMQSDVLDTFLRGFTEGARAANASVAVEQAWVHRNSTKGFMDEDEAGRIADGMYRNGTDVIFTCAGYSNMGAFDAARNRSGRYIIGTDTDQSPLGPDFVLASAVKRVDRVVYAGIGETINGTFTGGHQQVGLKEGVTGIVLNPEFAVYNTTLAAWETRAESEEAKYLASRTWDTSM